MALGSTWRLQCKTMSEDREYQRQLIAAIDAEIGVRRWSRAHLAAVAGINKQTLDRVFLLRRDMSVTQFGQIADALGVTPDYLTAQARGWSERTTDALVDSQSALTARQKAALKSEIGAHLAQTGNTVGSPDDVSSHRESSGRVRKRPAG